MSKEKNIELLKKCIDKWGIDSQINICIEELGELITALAKRNRKVNGSTQQNIKSEIADVQICLEQLKIIYDDTELSINNIINIKIEYLKNILEKQLRDEQFEIRKFSCGIF